MNKSNKTIGIIPARFGSTRLPGKLLLPIMGKTLIQRTYENARLATTLDNIYIATDDNRIFDHVSKFGASVYMTSKDCINGTERIAELLVNQEKLLKDVKAIVNIQGDLPCIAPEAIDEAVKLLLNDPSAVMSTLATPIFSKDEAENPSVVKCVVDKQQNALYFSRALIPSNKSKVYNPSSSYLRHIGLYVYRPDFLIEYQKLPSTPLQLEEDLEQLKVLEHGFRIKVALTNKHSIEVDVSDDVSKLEKWICKQNTSL